VPLYAFKMGTPEQLDSCIKCAAQDVAICQHSLVHWYYWTSSETVSHPACTYLLHTHFKELLKCM